MMKQWIKLFLTGCMIVSLAACGTATKKEDEAPAQTTEDTRSSIDTSSGVTGSAMEDLRSRTTIYFDFDKYEIRPEDRDILLAHAEYLVSQPDIRIVLEGHTDERGSREYNIGLGERRAKAAKQLMQLQGVAASQIDVVSYGEERPVATCHDESCWSQNRRVEIVYTGQ